MKICLVNNLFPPINTGSSFYTWGLAQSLCKRGHKVVVITNQQNAEDPTEEELEGIKVYRLPVWRLPRLEIWMNFPHFNFSLTPGNFRRVARILEKEQIEIIHQCNNIFDLVFMSAYFARKMKIPLFCSLMTQIQHSSPFYNKLLEWFERIVIKNLFARHVTRFVALDGDSARYLQERLDVGDRIFFVPYLIPEKDIQECLRNQKKDYDTTHFKMLSLGHLSHLKDRFETIRAWQLVVQKYPQAELIIVGDILSQNSQDLIRDSGLEKNVTFTGRVPHEQIFDYVEQVDASSMMLSESLPYHMGIGGANIEMMACGLPSILDASDDYLGASFPLRSGEHFVSAQDRDPQYLANEIISFFEDPAYRKRIGKAGQTFISTTLAWDNIMTEMERMYKESLT